MKTKIVLGFLGTIVLIKLLALIPAVGTILAMVLLLAIALTIVGYLIRRFTDVIATILVLLPFFAIFGIVALVLFFLFSVLY